MRTVVALFLIFVVIGMIKAAVSSYEPPTVHLTPAQCAAYVQQGGSSSDC